MCFYRYSHISDHTVSIRYLLLRSKRTIQKRTRRTRMGGRAAYQRPFRVRLMKRFRRWKNASAT